jgi:hypothetical protein
MATQGRWRAEKVIAPEHDGSMTSEWYIFNRFSIVWKKATPCSLMALLRLVVASAWYAQRSLAVPPGINGNITFQPPVLLGPARWGVTMFSPFSNTSWAVQMPDGLALTTDGGQSYAKPRPNAPHIGSNLVRAPTGELHDFGNVSAHRSSGGPWTSVTSSVATFFSVGASGTVEAETRPTPVTFRGLPTPIACDPSYGTCPIRLQGSGSVTFGDGSLLQSAIVYYEGGVGNFTGATSIVCFRSTDSFNWDYVGTLANATDYPWSEEGPNEHDLSVLDYGQVIAAVRMDAGDGKATHPYVDYMYTVSRDAGRTWTKLRWVGCSHDMTCRHPSLPACEIRTVYVSPRLSQGGARAYHWARSPQPDARDRLRPPTPAAARGRLRTPPPERRPHEEQRLRRQPSVGRLGGGELPGWGAQLGEVRHQLLPQPGRWAGTYRKLFSGIYL